MIPLGLLRIDPSANANLSAALTFPGCKRKDWGMLFVFCLFLIFFSAALSSNRVVLAAFGSNVRVPQWVAAKLCSALRAVLDRGLADSAVFAFRPLFWTPGPFFLLFFFLA